MPSDTGPPTLPRGSQKETEGRGNRNSGSETLDPCEVNATHPVKEQEMAEQRQAQKQREMAMAEKDKKS